MGAQFKWVILLVHVLQTPKIVSVLKQLRNYGGTLLHASLSQEQEETLQEALAP
jgi:uncharacterized membrane protein